ncbi:MAG: hypothetical protein ACE5PV_19200 [Candidatus Poribacteria bacterium]
MNRYLFVSLTLLAVFTGSVIASGKVVLVGSGAPDPKDAPIIEHLEKWGFTVEPHGHLEKHPVKLDGIDLVFISESTSSANILGAYKDSTVPVVNAETWTYDDMGFAPNDTGFNHDVGDTLKIVKKDHPITKGFSDKVKVYSSPIDVMTCNNFQGDVEVIAVRPDKEDFVAISVYEKGAKTITGKTKAIHVNIWPHSTAWNMVTDDGWKLIENSVLYALGRMPVEGDGRLAVTWGDIKNNR